MKANEAPKKIYLYPSDRAGKEYEDEWGTFLWGEDYVEYTRTDVFIEKAARWIENNLPKYSELTDEDEDGNKLEEPVMNVFHGKAVADFINYMQSE